MAFDLGGPVNKAAYIFATFTVSQRGTSSISMAAAMLSGMIPPLEFLFLCLLIKTMN